MRKYFILVSLLNAQFLHADKKAVDEFLKGSEAELLAEAGEALGSITASCFDDTIDPTRSGLVGEAIQRFGAGILQVLSERLLTLALKPDFPSVCHVLSNEHIDTFQTLQEEGSKCILKNPVTKSCALEADTERPIYQYYWPKYFVEVSQKGNDPFPAFAKRNVLYAANRKVSNELATWMDLTGPYKLLGKVVGIGTGIKAGMEAVTGYGLDMSAGASEVGEAAKAAVLTPFEKMRIRNSQNGTQPSYEVNIWPVGLSKVMAEHMTVCGDGNHGTEEGGYSWPIPGVPNTCPVAMAADAWPYWDTGLVDYLNPNAIRGMASSSSPATCVGDYMTTLALDGYDSTNGGPSVGNSDKIDSRVSTMDNSNGIRAGIRSCSFPILGDIEAIAGTLVDSAQNFKGPWCTPWGPIAPRNSTTTFNNDYAMANAALKFKELAHGLFGTPRGKKERWSLAYPWEPEPSGLTGFLSQYESTFKENLDIELPTWVTAVAGRSKMLMVPGDPRLVDSSIQISGMGEQAMMFGKELVYLGAIGLGAHAAGIAAEEAVKGLEYLGTGSDGQERVKQQVRDRHVGQEEALEERERVQDERERVSAKVDKQPIYEKIGYCHRWTSLGMQTKEHKAFGGRMYERGITKAWCLNTSKNSFAGCHDWGGARSGCRRLGQAKAYYKEVYEVVGYKEVIFPKFKYFKDVCGKTHYKKNRASSWAIKRRYQNEIWYQSCTQEVYNVKEKDTSIHDARPSADDPTSAFRHANEGSSNEAYPENKQHNDKAAEIAKNSAQIATWVGAELARAKYEQMHGSSLLPGKKRVYTIWEQVKCKAPVKKVKFLKEIGTWETESGNPSEGCTEAIRIELKKFLQKKLLRKACDSILDGKLGKPFLSH